MYVCIYCQGTLDQLKIIHFRIITNKNKAPNIVIPQSYLSAHYAGAKTLEKSAVLVVVTDCKHVHRPESNSEW